MMTRPSSGPLTDLRSPESPFAPRRATRVLAPGRGVAVRVITDDDKSYDPGSDADRLRAAGIPCKMAVGTAAQMHRKFARFDGRRPMTGSVRRTRCLPGLVRRPSGPNSGTIRRSGDRRFAFLFISFR